MTYKIAGLFAGIGGIEAGLHRGCPSSETVFLCESWEPARKVLGSHFGAPIHDDVAELKEFPPETNVVTAGFPCTDLSQAGRTAGIEGAASGLLTHVLRLIEHDARRGRVLDWLIVENVQNMLALEGGRAMAYLVGELNDLGYRWAYRVVDSRFTGVPQRRRRVLLVASPVHDPAGVLFAEDAGERPAEHYADDAFGFSWTEGKRGLGWAVDAVPTLKGGSTLGIPSPPGIWVPDAVPGRALVMPSIEDAEALQGFPRGWTSPADAGRKNGPRWKLVGNAVTVGVSEWLGSNLAAQRPAPETGQRDLPTGTKWPSAAWGERGRQFAVEVSEFPVHCDYQHLRDVVDVSKAQPLSHRGSAGFWSRLSTTNLGRHPGFREAVTKHVRATSGEVLVATG